MAANNSVQIAFEADISRAADSLDRLELLMRKLEGRAASVRKETTQGAKETQKEFDLVGAATDNIVGSLTRLFSGAAVFATLTTAASKYDEMLQRIAERSREVAQKTQAAFSATGLSGQARMQAEGLTTQLSGIALTPEQRAGVLQSVLDAARPASDQEATTANQITAALLRSDAIDPAVLQAAGASAGTLSRLTQGNISAQQAADFGLLMSQRQGSGSIMQGMTTAFGSFQGATPGMSDFERMATLAAFVEEGQRFGLAGEALKSGFGKLDKAQRQGFVEMTEKDKFGQDVKFKLPVPDSGNDFNDVLGMLQKAQAGDPASQRLLGSLFEASMAGNLVGGFDFERFERTRQANLQSGGALSREQQMILDSPAARADVERRRADVDKTISEQQKYGAALSLRDQEQALLDQERARRGQVGFLDGAAQLPATAIRGALTLGSPAAEAEALRIERERQARSYEQRGSITAPSISDQINQALQPQSISLSISVQAEDGLDISAAGF